MGVQVVHDKSYLFDIRVHYIHEILDLKRPVCCRAMLQRTYMVPPAERFHKGKDAARAVAYVFGVNLLVIPWSHCPRLTRFAKQLVRLLVHAHNGP